MSLLGGRYAPITDAIGFLEADFAQVVAADARWRASLGDAPTAVIQELAYRPQTVMLFLPR